MKDCQQHARGTGDQFPQTEPTPLEHLSPGYIGEQEVLPVSNMDTDMPDFGAVFDGADSSEEEEALPPRTPDQPLLLSAIILLQGIHAESLRNGRIYEEIAASLVGRNELLERQNNILVTGMREITAALSQGLEAIVARLPEPGPPMATPAAGEPTTSFVEASRPGRDSIYVQRPRRSRWRPAPHTVKPARKRGHKM